MKNFRSSKNLKIIQVNGKQDSQLRLKIKMLEQQIELLQKSNLNILIPLSQQQVKPTTNYQMIINKLKTQILNLQQQMNRLKMLIKKLQNDRQIQKISYKNEIQKLRQQIQQLKEINNDIKQQNNNLLQKLEYQQQKRKQKQKQFIELTVENKFLKDDILQIKKRKQIIQKKYQDIISCVLSVNFNSRIYKSKSIKITAIQTQQLQNMKLYIEQLQKKIKQLMNSKQQRIYLGSKKQNLGEEIVRLKQNIDLQLGLELNTETTKSFLTAYNQTNNKFNQLITSCKLKQ